MKILSSRPMEMSVLFIILISAAYLRFWNLEQNPAWYTDEATHIELARNLLKGESRYFAVDESFLLFARLPLFEYSLAMIFRVFGVGMLSLRAFTASFGLLTVVLLYCFMRDISRSGWLSLGVALSFAILPPAILYNRFGFSYNLLAPLILASIWAAYRYEKTFQWRYLALLSLCIGLGAISEFLMWSFLPLIFFIGKHWRDRFLSLALALVPLVLFFAWQLFTVKEAFLFDLGYSLGRTGGGTILQQIGRLAENMSILLTDIWWLLALIGIFMLRDALFRRTLLIFLLPLLLLARTVPLYSLSAYYTLPFFPILAIGIGIFFFYGLQSMWEKLRENFWRIIAFGIMAILLVPIAYICYKESDKVQHQYPTVIDAFLLNPQDVLAVVNYLHGNSPETALIFASAPVGALLDRPVIEFQMAVVALGKDSIHIPHELDPERFAYSADYQQADFVVIDNLWRNWAAVHIPSIGAILAEIETWELTFQSGALQVYKR